MSVEKIGRYEINGELGKGAMGIVYKATDPTIGRTVALKTMRLDVHAEKHDDMLRRFQNEARAAGVLNHPNIVTIYDAAEADGIFYIAMEYIQGTTLSRLLHDRHSLSAQEIVEIGTQICAGLQYAHFRKVVHRDIKPPNIMIAPGGSVKIMDFGIAKAGASLTGAGEVLGTPHYMSPEQVKGQDLDGRSDLFSTGVLLYEMATGEKPFTGQNVPAVIYKIVNEKAISPRELDVTIPAGLSMVITKCLEKDPDDRYQEAADLSTALKSYKIVSIPQQFSTGTVPMEQLRPAGPTKPKQIPAQPSPARPASQKLTPSTQTTSAPKAAAAAKPATTATRRMSKPQAKGGGGWARVGKAAIFLVAMVILVAAGAVAFKSLRPLLPSFSAMKTTSSTQPVSQASKDIADEHIDRVVQGMNQKGSKTASEQPGNTNVAETAPVAGIGDLRVTSNPPGAMVTVDGISQDYYVTPFNTPPLKSGTHTLTATIAGFPPQTRQVEVVAHKRTPVDFQLSGDKAIYNITSAPQGAEILIDGTAIGSRTPAQIPLTPGSHKVTLRLDGFQTVELMTQSAPGESVSLSPRLQARNSVDISEQTATDTPSLGSLAPMRRSAIPTPEGKGAVIVRTRPRGVTIVVDGYTVPRATPSRFPIRAGSHTVVLQKSGYQSVTRDIQVEEGKVTEIDELLAPQ